MMSAAQRKVTPVLDTQTVVERGGRCVGPWTLTIYRREVSVVNSESWKDILALTRTAINQIRKTINNVEDSLDVLVARAEPGRRTALKTYITEREAGERMVKTSKAAPKKPKGKLGKSVKKK